MVNLLPQYWQKKLKDEEVFKTVSILGIVVVLAMISFILMLFLVKQYYSVNVAYLDAAVVEKEQELKIFKTEADEKKAVATDELVSRIGNFYAGQIKITDLFSRVSGATPAGVDLASFGYYLNNIDIQGYATDRDALVSFKNKLESVPGFKKVIFPQDNWLKARDISFSANIELAGNDAAGGK